VIDGPAEAVVGLDEQLDVVQALGATMMLAIPNDGPSLDLPQVVDGFAAICDRAAERALTVALECVPCRPLADLQTSWRIVRESGAPNGGVSLDMMHWQFQSGGPDLDVLRSIPPQHVLHVQLCDAAPGNAPSKEEYIPRALTARLAPGDGIVDIAAVFAVLADIGADPFLSLEVFNTDLASQGSVAMAASLRETLDRLAV
jgi:sugar phosphate isomerase/epimerase